MTANPNNASFADEVFSLRSPAEFEQQAMVLFRYQSLHNPVYIEYIERLGRDFTSILRIEDIPFLPIGFFKSHQVMSRNFRPERVFSSSGTTGMVPSRHFVRKLAVYERSFESAFRFFYGSPSDYRFYGLLPSYLEREGSSLVYMVDRMIRLGGHAESGFHLNDHKALAERLQEANEKGFPAILIGVSFALLDFSEKFSFPLAENIVIMETGGMKGRRKEITREELHQTLCSRFRKQTIHSEYGMTELLSQAYARGNGRFFCPPWMKVMIRDIQDPFSYMPAGKTGAINIIDLANMHSCAFIETQDIGRLHEDGSFEVLGRTDSSDIRGCSLLIA